jgi:hypothetical protein
MNLTEMVCVASDIKLIEQSLVEYNVFISINEIEKMYFKLNRNLVNVICYFLEY